MYDPRIALIQGAESPLVTGSRRAHQSCVLRRMSGRKHGQRHAGAGARNLHHFEGRGARGFVSTAELHRIVIEATQNWLSQRLQLTSSFGNSIAAGGFDETSPDLLCRGASARGAHVWPGMGRGQNA